VTAAPAAAGRGVGLGNDVVDLADPETRLDGLHPRFSERVFTQAERSLLDACADRPRLLWSLWAAKESAYKALKQAEPDLVFSPRELEVTLEPESPPGSGCTAGVVACRDLVLDVCIRLADGSVHAVARGPGCAAVRVLSAVEPAGADPGLAVRRLATRVIGAALEVDETVLRISGRPPRVVQRGSRLDIALSLSHHGRFVAFAAGLPAGPPATRAEQADSAHLAGSAPRVRVAIE
jgi:phosphopantetheinyl transferase (holo-ACP synthase)